MPAHGDQHKANGATTANPFEEQKPHITEYTAQEIATLQSRLNKRLGPEFLSTRPGPGSQKIPYLSAEKAINLANEVFGFNGWSTSIQNIQIDFVDENPQTGKVSIGLSVVVRVMLKDGTYHEDIGYGSIENCKGKAMAFEKSKKEATTDALKRALRNFGNVLGNCVYDRDYVTKVSKIKAGNGRFDINELHRHPDFMPRINEDDKANIQIAQSAAIVPSLGHEESFDVSEFDDFDFNDNDISHSDEVLLPIDAKVGNAQNISRTSISSINTPSKPPLPRAVGVPVVAHSRPPGHQLGNPNGVHPGPSVRPNVPATRTAQIAGSDSESKDVRDLSSPGMPSEHFAGLPAQLGVPGGEPDVQLAGFYSARATANTDTSILLPNPPNAAKFNPHAESPSIRKTAGVDHTKSVPVRRELLKADAPNTSITPLDPRNEPNRRPGMPGPPLPSMQSVGGGMRPGMSTSAYRPPTRYGSPMVGSVAHGAITVTPAALPSNAAPPDRMPTAGKRPPLGDVSNMQHNPVALTNDGADVKRLKTGSSAVLDHAPDAKAPTNA